MLKQPSTSSRRQRRTEDVALGKKYGVSDRTIRTWRGLGAPFDNPSAMQWWMLANRGGDWYASPPPLPPGMDHSNILRFLVESAASHFLFVASSNTLDNLISCLIEEEGLVLQQGSV